MPEESMVQRGTRELSLRNELGDKGFEVYARRNEKRLCYEDGQLALGLQRTEAEIALSKAQRAYVEAKAHFWSMLTFGVLVVTLLALIGVVLVAVRG